MKKIVLAVGIAVLLASVGSASADLINYYSFENGDLTDTAGLYQQANGHDVSTVPTVNAAGTAPTFDAITRTGEAAGTKALHIYNNYGVAGNGGTQIDWTANDPDIALGSSFTIEWWANGDNYAATTTQEYLVANNYSIKFTSNHNWGTGTMSVAANGGAANSSPRYGAGWLHLVLVVDGSAGTFTNYVNPGATDGSERIITGATVTPTTTTTLRLGSITTYTNQNTYGYGVGAQIDDLAMWNTALDYATLTAHTVAGNPMLTQGPPPVLHHPGDINEDGTVDLQDFGTLKDNFGVTEGAIWTTGDLTGDGAVDLQDFGMLKDHFGHTVGDPTITAVPEPATMSLLALAGLGLLRKRNR